MRAFMKSIVLILLLMIFSACYDDYPVTEKQKVPVDQNLLGTWKIVAEYNSNDGLWNSFEEQGSMVVLKWSEREYVINFADLYFRAYGINLNEKDRVLQTELLERDNQYITSKFSVWSYEEQNDTLIISLLNHDLLNTTFTKPDSTQKFSAATYVKNSREYRNHVMSYSKNDSLFFNVYRCVRSAK